MVSKLLTLFMICASICVFNSDTSAQIEIDSAFLADNISIGYYYDDTTYRCEPIYTGGYVPSEQVALYGIPKGEVEKWRLRQLPDSEDSAEYEEIRWKFYPFREGFIDAYFRDRVGDSVNIATTTGIYPSVIRDIGYRIQPGSDCIMPSVCMVVSADTFSCKKYRCYDGIVIRKNAAFYNKVSAFQEYLYPDSLPRWLFDSAREILIDSFEAGLESMEPYDRMAYSKIDFRAADYWKIEPYSNTTDPNPQFIFVCAGNDYLGCRFFIFQRGVGIWDLIQLSGSAEEWGLKPILSLESDNIDAPKLFLLSQLVGDPITYMAVFMYYKWSWRAIHYSQDCY